MTGPSLMQQVIDRCQEALFTGTIRVHTRQAEGEIWLLSGIVERVRFGVSVDDEAMGRLLAAAAPRVELIPCLPNPRGGFNKGHPIEGELGATLPVDLLRFCERYSLTCTIELRTADSSGEVVYRLGELVSVRCDAGTDRAVAQMLEWSEGRYKFVLPTVEMPALSPVRVEPPSLPPPSEEAPPPDSSAWRNASNEALKRKAEEAYAKSLAEAKRIADEAEAEIRRQVEEAHAEAKRAAEEAAAKRAAEEAEAKRIADEAEAKRIADEAEAKRIADEAEGRRLIEEAEARSIAAEAEAKRLVEEAEARSIAAEAEAKRLVEEAEAKRIAAEAEAKRLADEAEVKRIAEEAEAKRIAAEAEVKRIAAEAEVKRLADEAQARLHEAARAEAASPKGSEAKRKAEEKRDAKAKRKLAAKTRAEEARAAQARPSEAPAAKTYSVSVRLRRVTTEYIHVSVPVTPSVMKKDPEADGSYQIDTDALFAEAVRVAASPVLAWKPEGEPIVEVHPIQKPPS